MPEGSDCSVPVSRAAGAGRLELSSCLPPVPALWCAAGLACGDLVDGFACSANGGIVGDRDRDDGGECITCGIVGDRDRDDEAGSEEVAPDAKASGGAACRGFRLPADLKGPISN